MEQPITTKNVGQPCVICGQAADAQATIAALQARVQELEEWKHIVTGAGTDQESVIRLAAYEYTKIAVQCWKEANARLESQLIQRTAELEAANKLLYKKNCELGRFETIISKAQAELERVRGELVEATHNANVYQSLYSTGCMDRALLENKLRDIRTLILALPKVEGDWTVSCAMADRVVEGGIVSDISEAVAAIVQHRQGMEG